jgi:hypothetical protein
MRKESWKRHPNDHMNVHMWTLEHHENFFFLQKEDKTKDYPSQLTYKHYWKLFGCWSLGIMEHFPWMQPLVPMCKGTPFHLDGV